MNLLVVTIVLSIGLVCAASSDDYGSELVRALMRESARSRPVLDKPQRYDTETEFDDILPKLEERRPFAGLEKREPMGRTGYDKLDMARLAFLARELYDSEGPCVDRELGCEEFYDNGQCWEKDLVDSMKDSCKKTCGYCRCQETRYGCCTSNGKVPAEGYHKKGCGKKLCIDLDLKCQADQCKIKEDMAERCSYTCKACDRNKALSPPRGDCNAGNINKYPHGCCWDGSAATSADKQKGCPICADISPYLCSKHKDECGDTRFPNIRAFMFKCHQTCGRCTCFNQYSDAVCEGPAKRGDCNRIPEVQENCRKACNICDCEDEYGKSFCQAWKKSGRCSESGVQAKCRETCHACQPS